LLSYPSPNVGIYEYTKAPADVGKFKAPTLRNIALTAPYMHDGSIPTLEGVLNHYAAGGRAHDNPNKDPLIGGFTLSEQDRKDLIAAERNPTMTKRFSRYVLSATAALFIAAGGYAAQSVTEIVLPGTRVIEYCPPSAGSVRLATAPRIA